MIRITAPALVDGVKVDVQIEADTRERIADMFAKLQEDEGFEIIKSDGNFAPRVDKSTGQSRRRIVGLSYHQADNWQAYDPWYHDSKANTYRRIGRLFFGGQYHGPGDALVNTVPQDILPTDSTMKMLPDMYHFDVIYHLNDEGYARHDDIEFVS